MKFRLPEHQKIAEVLASMDAQALLEDRCYFGGGTAIVLQNGEYRRSLDVDFLCADVDGYRRLRSAVALDGAQALFGAGIETLREFRTDQYGLRGLVRWSGQDIKFEIVREARIDLDGAIDPQLRIPVLALVDQFAEKLLANADRCLDRAIAYRDLIDLGILVMAHGGTIPREAVEKAERAYGDDVAKKARIAIERLSTDNEIRYAAETLCMDVTMVRDCAYAFREAATRAWPSMGLQVDPAR